jgi:ketosteroid isomerase-like protein
MSSENIELVRSLAETFEARDLDAVLEHFSTDVEWHEEPSFPEADVYRGLEAVRAYMSQFLAEFSEMHFQPVDLSERGEHVIANLRVSGRGRTSGATFELDAWWALTVRDGKVTRCIAYLDRDRMLEALEREGSAVGSDIRSTPMKVDDV